MHSKFEPNNSKEESSLITNTYRKLQMIITRSPINLHRRTISTSRDYSGFIGAVKPVRAFGSAIPPRWRDYVSPNLSRGRLNDRLAITTDSWPIIHHGHLTSPDRLTTVLPMQMTSSAALAVLKCLTRGLQNYLRSLSCTEPIPIPGVRINSMVSTWRCDGQDKTVQ